MSALERRYDVVKLEDPKEKHKDCQFFVLDLTHDPHARHAAHEYAMAIDDRPLAEAIRQIDKTIKRAALAAAHAEAEPTPDQTWCDLGRHQQCSGYTEDEADPESCMCGCHDAIEKAMNR